MAMNSSGPISLGGATAGQSINLENGNSATAQVSLNDTAVRNLAGVASGAITMPTDFYGKSNIVNISYTFSSNTANASLNVTSISGYSAGKSNITITINAGVYLYATSTANAGLTLTGGTTGDTITVVNNGYIMGQGGTGGSPNANTQTVTAATVGGPALNVSGIGISSITVNNTNASAYIGGGGGGGGGGNNYISSLANKDFYGSGSGGGGGAGGGTGGFVTVGRSSCCGVIIYTTNGGTGGSIGLSGGNGSQQNSAGSQLGGSGGGGGRIFPGTGGTGTSIPLGSGVGGKGGGSGGAGGGGSLTSCCGVYTLSGGGGGGWGASGGGTGGSSPTLAGGSANASGGNGGGGGGAAGGKAVNLGGKSITWTSGNTTRVYGSVA